MKIVLKPGIDPAVRDLILKVRDAYLQHLHNCTLFELKLNRLTVTVTKRTDDFYPRYEGVCRYTRMSKDRSMRERYSIEIVMMQDSNMAATALVIAHEFAHLLFHMSHNIIGTMCSDGLMFYSAVSRRLWDIDQNLHGEEPESAGVSMQDGLEEFCADALAYYIVNKIGMQFDGVMPCHEDDDEEELEEIKTQWNERMRCINRFTEVFGDPLADCDFIDEVAECEDGIERVRNWFWYYVVTFQMNLLMEWIDRMLGAGTYMRLDMEFARLQFASSSDTRDYTRINEMLARLEQLPKYQLITENQYTREYRMGLVTQRIEKYDSELNEALRTLARIMKVAAVFKEVVHPELGRGRIVSFDKALNCVVRFDESTVTLPLNDIVEKCDFPEEETCKPGCKHVRKRSMKHARRLITACQLSFVRGTQDILRVLKQKRDAVG